MKKMCSMIMAVLLMVCLSVPVMATSLPSPGKDPEAQGGTITKDDGTQVDVNDPEEMKGYIEVTVSEEPADKVDGFNTLFSFDVSFKNGAVSGEVNFYVPGVKKGSNVKVRIFINGQWVDVDAVVIDDNLVRVNVPGSGRVEILTEATDSPTVAPEKPGNNDNNNTGGNTSGSNASGTSPKTGEGEAFPMACAMAVVFGVAAVAAGCKAKRVK